MAFVDELQSVLVDAQREQSTKPPSAVALRDRLLPLTGHPGSNGTRWLTSVEAAEFAGIKDYKQARSGFRAIHAAMTGLGWREGRVGAGRIKVRGYVRGEPLTAEPLSPHHAEAVATIRDTLARLAPLGLSDVELTAAWFDARAEVPAEPAAPTTTPTPAAPRRGRPPGVRRDPVAPSATAAHAPAVPPAAPGLAPAPPEPPTAMPAAEPAAEPAPPNEPAPLDRPDAAPAAPVDRRVRPARRAPAPPPVPAELPTLAAILDMLGPSEGSGSRDRRRA